MDFINPSNGLLTNIWLTLGSLISNDNSNGVFQITNSIPNKASFSLEDIWGELFPVNPLQFSSILPKPNKASWGLNEQALKGIEMDFSSMRGDQYVAWQVQVNFQYGANTSGIIVDLTWATKSNFKNRTMLSESYQCWSKLKQRRLGTSYIEISKRNEEHIKFSLCTGVLHIGKFSSASWKPQRKPVSEERKIKCKLVTFFG